MIQVYNDTEYIFIPAESDWKYDVLRLILKHNTNRDIYILDFEPERMDRFFRYPLIFKENAPFGEYTYYLTPDGITIEDLNTFEIWDTEITENESCTRRINILSSGLLFRNDKKVKFNTYEQRRIYTEYSRK